MNLNDEYTRSEVTSSIPQRPHGHGPPNDLPTICDNLLSQGQGSCQVNIDITILLVSCKLSNQLPHIISCKISNHPPELWLQDYLDIQTNIHACFFHYARLAWTHFCFARLCPSWLPRRQQGCRSHTSHIWGSNGRSMLALRCCAWVQEYLLYMVDMTCMM